MIDSLDQSIGNIVAAIDKQNLAQFDGTWKLVVIRANAMDLSADGSPLSRASLSR